MTIYLALAVESWPEAASCIVGILAALIGLMFLRDPAAFVLALRGGTPYLDEPKDSEPLQDKSAEWAGMVQDTRTLEWVLSNCKIQTPFDPEPIIYDRESILRAIPRYITMAVEDAPATPISFRAEPKTEDVQR